MFGNDPKKYELLALVRYNNGMRNDTLAYVRDLNTSVEQKKVACLVFDGLPSYFLDRARKTMDLAVVNTSSLIEADFNSETISEKPFSGMKRYGSLAVDSYDVFERDLAIWAEQNSLDSDFKIGKDRNHKLLESFAMNDPYVSGCIFCEDNFLTDGYNYTALKDAVIAGIRDQKQSIQGFYNQRELANYEQNMQDFEQDSAYYDDFYN